MKKKMMFGLFILLVFSLAITPVMAQGGLAEIDLCVPEVKRVFRFGGYLLTAIKIIVPILIIIMGSVDFAKAVTSSKEDEIKRSATSLAKRIVAGVVIFFVPTIIATIFNFVEGYSETKLKYEACWECLFHPGDCQ